MCDAGIVFLPGAAGTVQEIFQDACENYYASPDGRGADGARRAGVLDHRPPGLAAAAVAGPRAGRWRTHIHLVDTVDEAVELVAAD